MNYTTASDKRGFLAAWTLLRVLHARGLWTESLAEDWDHLVQWGWLLGISLPENVEDYL